MAVVGTEAWRKGMKTKAFVADRDGRVRLRDVEVPEPAAQDLMVRAVCTGVSIGTESLWLSEQLADGKAWVCTGYQAVGVVGSVGADVKGLQPGDVVAYNGQPAMALAADGQTVATCNGAHAAHAVLPAKRAVPVPEGVDPAPACLFVVFGTGLHGVDRAKPRLDDWVVVHGCGLVGLGVVTVCALHGCRVIAIDRQPHRLNVARQLGAIASLDARDTDIEEAVRTFTDGGADVVFEATGVPACLGVAARLCRKPATFVFQGNYGRITTIEHDFRDGHWKELNMLHTCGYGGNRAAEAFLRHLQLGHMPWDAAITHRRKAQDAEELLDDVLNRRVGDVLGMVIEW